MAGAGGLTKGQEQRSRDGLEMVIIICLKSHTKHIYKLGKHIQIIITITYEIQILILETNRLRD